MKQTTQCTAQTLELLIGTSSPLQDPLPGGTYVQQMHLSQVPPPPYQKLPPTISAPYMPHCTQVDSTTCFSIIPVSETLSTQCSTQNWNWYCKPAPLLPMHYHQPQAITEPNQHRCHHPHTKNCRPPYLPPTCQTTLKLTLPRASQ